MIRRKRLWLRRAQKSWASGTATPNRDAVVNPVQQPLTDLAVQRRIVYMRLLEFSDRRVNPDEPLKRSAHVGAKNSAIREVPRDIFDEALYLDVLYLHPHKKTTLTSFLSSSGIVDMDAIIPNGEHLRVDLDDYQRSSGGHLAFDLTLRNVDEVSGLEAFHQYVITSRHYYNGYQYDDDGDKYQSDGGLLIDSETDQVTLICDFTALDDGTFFRDGVEPKAIVISKDGGRLTLADPYVNGVLTAIVPEPEVGSRLLCDWEWPTESEGLEFAQ